MYRKPVTLNRDITNGDLYPLLYEDEQLPDPDDPRWDRLVFRKGQQGRILESKDINKPYIYLVEFPGSADPPQWMKPEWFDE